ncbi:MAG: sensor domain-containing diguanylate cyclase [Thermoleophilia bacterium]|nr:sensor domain-containing diguanylate cyclase [Thermoleophilia bacterium]
MLYLADSLSWTTFGIAVGGAGLAVLVLLLAIARRRRPSMELETMLRESSTRVEAMISDLSTQLDQANEQNARSQQLAEIGTTIDLDEVLARTLEAAGALLGVDGAMITLENGDEAVPLVATVGLSDQETSAQVAARDWGRRRAAVVSYLYPGEADLGEPIRGSAHVPIRSDGDEIVGTLSVFWRTIDRTPGAEQVELLEELAVRAGPAIGNARRFQEARQLADLDALTGLHNYRYFHETLAREVARAHRYSRHLALVVFDIDDFKAVNDRIGHLAGDSVLAEAAHRVRSVVRGADIACRVGGDEFAVILPEATTADAESLYRRLQAAMANWRPNADHLRLSAGIAELEPEDDAVSLFKRADEALYRAKAGGKGQAIAATAEL